MSPPPVCSTHTAPATTEAAWPGVQLQPTPQPARDSCGRQAACRGPGRGEDHPPASVRLAPSTWSEERTTWPSWGLWGKSDNPTSGSHTSPFQAKPHVLPVTQGPRWDGAGVDGQPSLASRHTGLQAHPTALVGSLPPGRGQAEAQGTLEQTRWVSVPRPLHFLTLSLAWKWGAFCFSFMLKYKHRLLRITSSPP